MGEMLYLFKALESHGHGFEWGFGFHGVSPFFHGPGNRTGRDAKAHPWPCIMQEPGLLAHLQQKSALAGGQEGQRVEPQTHHDKNQVQTYGPPEVAHVENLFPHQ